MSVEHGNKLHIGSLDGLRGLAAIFVIASHTSIFEMYFFPNVSFSGIGKYGVYLFFLLSSFLLTRQILSKEKEFFSLKGILYYWERRFLRIYPLYIVYLVFFCSMRSMRLYDDFWLGFEEIFLSHVFLQEGRSVAWSIVVEFKFYFILPFLCYVGMLLHKRCGSLFVVGGLAVGIFFGQVFLFDKAVGNDIRLLPYLSVFFAGVMFAYIERYIVEKDLANSSTFQFLVTGWGWGSAIGLVFIIPSVFFSVTGWDYQREYFHGNYILFCFLWGGVLFSAVFVSGIMKRFFEAGILRFFGKISFGLYLNHCLILVIVYNVLGRGNFYSAWVLLFVSIAIAYLTYEIIEKPANQFRFLKSKNTA